VATEERLNKLERELKELKDKLEERVKTRAVEVVDEQGRGRVVLEVTGDGAPELILCDVNNRPRARLTVDQDGEGPWLILTDVNGRDRVELNVTGDGPGLRLYDVNGKRIWSAP
jgi:hypothetical protein